ncbi:unnamed protein product [Brachionus calyciflorus]|uniref:Uncharacterized protein n=1 Tax=Brachionus calyciflorus TaxID=104777 RepID=A0A814ALB7_9BILA|nr:unnamed protein product [Brachionus calyciflorus]
MNFAVTQAPTATQFNIENQAAQQSEKGSCGCGAGCLSLAKAGEVTTSVNVSLNDYEFEIINVTNSTSLF